jgi:ribokinase
MPHDIKQGLGAIADATILLMQLETPMETVEFAARHASSNHVKVILNPAPVAQLSAELLSYIDIITPNRTEAEMISGIKINDIEDATNAAQLIFEKGVSSVVVTMGALGSVVYHEGKFEVIPAQIVNAIDTTAAGDVFNGAVAVALSEGQELAEAVRFASRAAAISVTRLGAQSSIPYRNEIITEHL